MKKIILLMLILTSFSGFAQDESAECDGEPSVKEFKSEKSLEDLGEQTTAFASTLGKDYIVTVGEVSELKKVWIETCSESIKTREKGKKFGFYPYLKKEKHRVTLGSWIKHKFFGACHVKRKTKRIYGIKLFKVRKAEYKTIEKECEKSSIVYSTHLEYCQKKKEPLALNAKIDAKYPSCLVQLDETNNASDVKSKLNEIAAKVAEWKNTYPSGTCKIKVTGKASFTPITTACAGKINGLAGTSYPTDAQVTDTATLKDMNDVLAQNRGANAGEYLTNQIASGLKVEGKGIEIEAASEVIGTPSGEVIEADSAEALAKQKMEISVDCK